MENVYRPPVKPPYITPSMPKQGHKLKPDIRDKIEILKIAIEYSVLNFKASNQKDSINLPSILNIYETILQKLSE